jgi:hypothetical protein
VFTNRKRSVVLLAFAAAVVVTAACSADVTAPPPVKPLALKQRLNLDTAEMCPYGWIVMGGRVVCDDPGT